MNKLNKKTMTEKQVLEETIAKWNDSVNDISKFKFNSKEVDLFCDMLKRFGEMKVSQALTLTDVGNCKLNTYHIETQDTTGRFNFFTSAKNHKKALKQLLKNSSDYKNIVKANRDLKITIKRIDKPT
jgi:hypothetical protein